jgi:molybdopterin synthase sulfur carrier subunit
MADTVTSLPSVFGLAMRLALSSHPFLINSDYLMHHDENTQHDHHDKMGDRIIPAFRRSRLMSIKVYYFASLRDTLGKAEDNGQVTGSQTVSDVWQQFNPENPRSSSVLCAVNHTYASMDHPVSDGDEIAFFPTVTGG